MRWSIEGRIGAGFGLALVLLVLLGVSSYRSTTVLISTSGWVTHTRTVLENLEATLSGLKAIESESRGYVITGDERFVSHHRRIAAELTQATGQLRKLMADNHDQRHRLDRLEPLVASRLAWTDSVITTTTRMGSAAGASLIRSGRGKARMDDAEQLIAEMATAETDLLQAREVDARNGAQRTLWITVIWTLAAVALIGLAYATIRLDLTRRRRAEATLRENETRLQAILDNTTAAIYVKDLQGRYLLVNKVVERLLQKTSDELRGTMVYDLMDQDTAERIRANDQAVLASSSPLVLEEVAPLHDGTHTFLSVKCSLRGPDGVPYGLCGISTDITDRKRAEEELARSRLFLDSIIDNIPNMVFVKDARELRFVRFNRAGEELLGYSRDDLLGKNDYDFFPQEQANFFTAKDRQVMEQGEVLDIAEESIQTRHRGIRTLHTKKVPILDPNGASRYLLGISEDITERKRSEQQIQALNEHAKWRAEELEATNKELEAFSYSVSHDLRAPVRHIDGFADLLRRHAGSTLDEKARRYLDLISDSARSMGSLIDDLLVFSRMGRAELQRTTVALGQLVIQVRESLAEESSGREIEWRIAPLPQVQGDPAMLKLVITNLLANAIKYTRTRPSARIEIGATESEKETTVFVRDNGVGFDMKYSHKLFGVFQRLHRQEEFEGTGIGLANVRRIINRHGGRTWAEGELGRGATFYFSLPKLEDEVVETREAA